MFKVIYRIILVVAIIYNLFVLKKKQEKSINDVIKKEVIFRDCNLNRSTSIRVKYRESYKRVEIPEDACYQLIEGDSIDLVYNTDLKTYYYPKDNSEKYVAYFLFFFLIVSFINLSEIKRKLKF